MSKKKGKVVSWFVVDPKTGKGLTAWTRQDARDVKLSTEKILRVEIVDGQPTAKFVR